MDEAAGGAIAGPVGEHLPIPHDEKTQRSKLTPAQKRKKMTGEAPNVNLPARGMGKPLAPVGLGKPLAPGLQRQEKAPAGKPTASRPQGSSSTPPQVGKPDLSALRHSRFKTASTKNGKPPSAPPKRPVPIYTPVPTCPAPPAASAPARPLVICPAPPAASAPAPPLAPPPAAAPSPAAPPASKLRITGKPFTPRLPVTATVPPPFTPRLPVTGAAAAPVLAPAPAAVPVPAGLATDLPDKSPELAPAVKRVRSGYPSPKGSVLEELRRPKDDNEYTPILPYTTPAVEPKDEVAHSKASPASLQASSFPNRSLLLSFLMLPETYT